MRHAYFGRKLSRSTDERKRLLMGLARDMFKTGAIKTTIAKAKAVRPMVEKLITRAKKGSQHDYRQVLATLGESTSVKRLMDDAKARFAGRNSGYTRIVRLGKRLGDATDMAVLSFVDEPLVEVEVVKAPAAEVAAETKKEPAKKRTVKKAAK